MSAGTKTALRPGTVDPEYALRILEGLDNASRIVSGQDGPRADFARRQIALAEKIMLTADAAIRSGVPELAAQLHQMVGDAWRVSPVST